MTDHTPNYPPIQDTTEEWRPVPGFEGCYEVSSLGRVKSVRRKDCRDRTVPERYIKQRVDRGGYFIVTMKHKPRSMTTNTHRLVAEVFLPRDLFRTEVNHKNGNKLDNRADNLEWVTPGENVQHAFDTGLNRFHKPKLTNADVAEIKQLLRSGMRPVDIAPLYNVARVTIQNIKSGRYWKNVA